MRVSGCMIAKNEERCIARCIESYREIVDEIIVVDTGSTDRTVEIAESMGAQVIHFPWIDDFAAAKNQALQRATGDWILFLDADEFFRPGDARKLHRFLKINETVSRVHILVVRLVNIERDGSVCKDQPLLQCSRVFRGNMGIHYEGAIHEDIRLADGSVCNARSLYDEDIVILHDGYKSEIVRQKIMRNHEILLRELERTPNRTDLHDYLSHGFVQLGDYEQALQHSMIALTDDRTNPFHRARALGMTVDLYARTKRTRNALMDLLDGIRPRFERVAHYYNIMGTQYALRNQYRAAMRMLDMFLHLLEDPAERKFTENLLTPRLLAGALTIAAKVYLLCGEREKAIRTVARSLDICRLTDNAELYVLLTVERDEREVLEVLERSFSSDSIEDLEAVLDLLRRYRVDTVYYTFFERYFAKTGKQDVRFLTMLTGIGEGASASAGYLERYRITRETVYLSKAFVAAVLSGSRDALVGVHAAGNAEYRAFVEFWLDLPGPEDRPFSVDEYVSVLGDLFAYPGYAQVLDRWIQLGRQVSPVLTQRVAMLLFDKARYAYAMPLMEEVYEAFVRQGVPQASVFAMNCCKGYYYLGNYEKAVEYVYLALERGKHLIDVGEFAYMISEHLDEDSKQRRDLQRLSRMLDDLGPLLFEDVMTPVQNENARKAILGMLDRLNEVNRAIFVHGLAMICNRQGDIAGAEREYRRSYAIQPRLALALARDRESYAYRDVPCETVDACPICGAAARPRACLDIVRDARFDAAFSPIRVWMECGECGHVFVRDWPVEAPAYDGGSLDRARDPQAALAALAEGAQGDAFELRVQLRAEGVRDPQAEEDDPYWNDCLRAQAFGERSLRRLCEALGLRAERLADVEEEIEGDEYGRNAADAADAGARPEDVRAEASDGASMDAERGADAPMEPGDGTHEGANGDADANVDAAPAKRQTRTLSVWELRKAVGEERAS